MPARRRIPESESDNNFSVLIDDCVVYANEQKKLTTDSQQFSGDNKKEFITQTGQQLLGNKYSVAGFAIPNGITKLSSSIGQFLQQQVIQTNVEQPSVVTATVDLGSNPSLVEGINGYDDEFGIERDTEILEIMASRDRTGEFFTAIRSMQGRNITKAVNIRDPRKVSQLHSYSEFMTIAKHIGKNIAGTYSKLEKLTICMYLSCFQNTVLI